MTDELKIAVFASGNGSNLRALIGSIRSGNVTNARIVAVISNNADAGALAIAGENGIPAFCISRKKFGSDGEFNSALTGIFEKYGVNFILLAGYMKKLAPEIVRKFKNCILNIHPALLPRYGGAGMYGDNVHREVLANKEKFSGATVHIVDEEYDHGPIVLQEIVPVEKDDTVETLKARVLKIEHKIYSSALRLFAEGRVKVEGTKVVISDLK